MKRLKNFLYRRVEDILDYVDECYERYEQLRTAQATQASLTKERRVPCGVTLIVRDRAGRILMAKRKAKHGKGTWAFPGGWMEHRESFFATAKREAKEEVDINVTAAEVLDVYDTYFPEVDLHCVTVLMLATEWSGVPKVMEPDKIDGKWQFFDLKYLPDPLFEPVRLNLINILMNLQRKDREVRGADA